MFCKNHNHNFLKVEFLIYQMLIVIYVSVLMILDIFGVMLILFTLVAVTTSNPQADSPKTPGHTKDVPLQIFPA